MSEVKTTTLNNQMGHRGRHHRNYLLCPGQGILPFIGVSIPPALRVLDEYYTQKGKWSHTTWTVELAPGYDVMVWHQDWGNGKWFPTQTWEATLQEVRRRIDQKELIAQITDEQIIAWIRAEFKETATRLDAEESKFLASEDTLAQLFAAQKELAAIQEEEAAVKISLEKEIQAREAIEVAEREAKESVQRVSAAKAVLGKGKTVSLADLKAALAA